MVRSKVLDIVALGGGDDGVGGVIHLVPAVVVDGEVVGDGGGVVGPCRGVHATAHGRHGVPASRSRVQHPPAHLVVEALDERHGEHIGGEVADGHLVDGQPPHRRPRRPVQRNRHEVEIAADLGVTVPESCPKCELVVGLNETALVIYAV